MIRETRIPECRATGVQVSCADSPVGSRVSLRILTGRLIAIMSSGFRDPAPNSPAASKAETLNAFPWIVGSAGRHLIQLFIRAPARFRGVHRPRSGNHDAHYRGPGRLGYPVARSRPQPRGGSTAWSSERSSSTIPREASASAPSCWLPAEATIDEDTD